MRISVRLLATFLLALLSTSLASAQGQSESDEGKKITFTTLSLWGKVKLGAAYFTDPQLSQQTQVHYGYDPTDFDPAKISDLEKQGTVLCVVSMSQAGNAYTPEFAASGCLKTSSNPAYVVSKSSDLLGKKPDVLLQMVDKPSKD
jgi:hypothetical protein